MEQSITTTSKVVEEIDQMLFDEHSELQAWLSEQKPTYQPFVRKSVRIHLSEIKKHAESQIEALEEKYDFLTKDGAPFKEKQAVGYRLERACGMLEQVTADLANLEVRDLADWLEHGDVVEIKKHGFHKAIGRPELLNRAYVKRNPTT